MKMNNHLSTQTIGTQNKTMTYGVGNPGLCLRQAHNSGKIKWVNGIPTLPPMLIRSKTCKEEV